MAVDTKLVSRLKHELRKIPRAVKGKQCTRRSMNILGIY